MNSSQTSHKPIEPWFETLIQQALASLYLLNLEGCPAADSVGKTTRLWLRLLWDKPRSGWVQQLDDPRIRQAFAHIAETSKRWPSPAVFWESLPKRPEPPKGSTIGAGWGRERQREALECMDRWLAELGYDRTGSPVDA